VPAIHTGVFKTTTHHIPIYPPLRVIELFSTPSAFHIYTCSPVLKSVLTLLAFIPWNCIFALNGTILPFFADSSREFFFACWTNLCYSPSRFLAFGTAILYLAYL
jgi:hypothetical protein